jgi:hypothetical protein
MGEMRYPYKYLFGRPDEKRPFGSSGHRWRKIL